jgi:hypothetical protein
VMAAKTVNAAIDATRLHGVKQTMPQTV